MKNLNPIMLVAAILPLALFIFPLWSIELHAPQYPQGIGMEIWIDKIADQNPNDIKNINLLNHYVGMKYIPEHMAEFDVFPPVVIGMSLLGIVFAFIGKRNLFLFWAILFMILGAVGMYDFYLWEYDYGHNLDPKAAIKIPGQGYQPPLIGKKMILNFEAVSLPMTGAYLLGLGILLSVWAWYRKKSSSLQKGVVSALILFVISSCTPQVEPIQYGNELCASCKMNIVDQRYASQLVTQKGKNFKYDAIECMLEQSASFTEEELFGLFVSTPDQPGEMINAINSSFLISEKLPSPMSANINGFKDKSTAQRYQEEFGGEVKSWEELNTWYHEKRN